MILSTYSGIVAMVLPISFSGCNYNGNFTKSKDPRLLSTPDVKDFLVQRANSCIEAGITKDHIIIDPGFGFGKTVDHNYSLIKHLDQFVSMDYPVLVGVSRKSMIGAVLNNEVSDRLSASVTLAAMACRSGAHLFRVHDVKATADALAVCRSVRAAV